MPNPQTGTTHVDPVCGMKVSAEKAAGTTGHENTRYFFCSQGCLRKFESDPEKYLRRGPRVENMGGAPNLIQIGHTAPLPSRKSAQKNTIYVCPRDPEI